MQWELKKSRLTKKEVNRVLGSATSGGGMACHYFGDTDQWSLPTREKYVKLQSTGFFEKSYEDLRREYEDLRHEYEDLRREYEDLRYTFNLERGVTDVWCVDFYKDRVPWHPTSKPLKLIERIIKTSTNEGGLVLDPFLGSGTTALVCKRLNRRYIGIEINPEYVELAKKRKVNSQF